MPHRNPLPPDHPDSPASTFAPRQPGARVVADDVPEEDRAPGSVTAAEATAADAKEMRTERAQADDAQTRDEERRRKELDQAAEEREQAAQAHRATVDGQEQRKAPRRKS